MHHRAGERKLKGLRPSRHWLQFHHIPRWTMAAVGARLDEEASQFVTGVNRQENSDMRVVPTVCVLPLHAFLSRMWGAA